MKRKITLLAALLFMACTTFAQSQLVTFQVENPDSTPVFVFGSWNIWGNWPGTPMTMVAPGKYSATIAVPANATYEYLYVNGSPSTAVKEVLNPAWPCTNGNAQYTNRVIAVGNVDTGVCNTWATCNTCTVTPPPPPPTPINVTFQVQSPDSTPVHVAGSWNWTNWPGIAMTSVGGGKYSATVSLLPNAPYEFLFVNGNTPQKEILNAAWPCTNGNAQYTNRTLALGANDTTICFTWATCTACPIVPPPANANITFRVESPDSLPVYIRGSWNNWATNTLMNSIGNNKYEVVIPMAKSATYEFKYQNGAGQSYETLNPTWPCTNGNAQYTNRALSVGLNDTTLCNMWSSCNTCTVPQTNVLYTFQVSNPDSTPVYLLGSWNWGAFPGTLMTAIGGGKYQATINLPINDTTIEYLYVNGTATKEVLNPAWPCTNGNGQYTNRKIINTGIAPKTLCNKWASCDTCGQVTPTIINVKFGVQAPDSTPVYIFGSWNNWSGFPGAPMTFNAAKAAYEVSVPLQAGATIEYLYVNGTTTKEILNAAWPCTNGNAQYTNRMVTLGNTDTILCNRWATCNACVPLAIGNTIKDEVRIEVGNQFVKINSYNYELIDGLEIYDLVGKRIFSSNGKVKTNQNISVNLQANILYIISVKNNNDYYKTKAIIKN